MTGHPKVPLGELCEITAGPSGSLLEQLHEGPDGVPVIAPPNLTDQHTVDTRRLRRIPLAEAEKLRRFAVEEGDILFVRQGTLGRLALMGPEHTSWLYGSAFLRIRPRSGHVLATYLAAYLAYEPVQKAILSQTLPGTVPSLSRELFHYLPVTLPPMDLQRQIVDTMTDIRTLLGIQRQLTERLEVLEQAVFGEILQVGESV
jgi:type I restriction enzyme S subunit